MVITKESRNFAPLIKNKGEFIMEHLIEERYISLLTDFGFKRIFGSKPNKDLLINFLNSLFKKEQVITDVKYLNSEHVGDVYTDRKAIFDVYCENEKGEKFIVEMQNAYQKYFKDRSLYYATFPIKEQAPKSSDWDFNLSHVYVVALLNFDMKEDSFDTKSISHDIGLLDKKTKKVFNDKLTFKYVEIAKFDKPLSKLRTHYDKWLFALKYLPKLAERPKELRDKIFDKLFKEAEIAKFTKKELREYEDSLKAYRDIKNSLDTALQQGFEKGHEKGKEEGLAEGLAEGRDKRSIEIAREMLAEGESIEKIMRYTGLTEAQIKEFNYKSS